MEHFSTDRLIARDWAVGDDQGAFGIYGRPEVARWLGAPPQDPVGSLAEMRRRLERMIARDAGSVRFGLWALELRGSGQVAGAVLLVPIEGGGEDDYEIGWHLNPDHWGHGYATEAGRGVIDLAFGSYGLDRVLAVVYPDNHRSLAVCRRLGMTHHGQTDRYYGVTLELFSLSRDDPAGGPAAS
jgi:RimJ/RimL family protein N-acetyltransferase